jgi:hypothetical protein
MHVLNNEKNFYKLKGKTKVILNNLSLTFPYDNEEFYYCELLLDNSCHSYYPSVEAFLETDLVELQETNTVSRFSMLADSRGYTMVLATSQYHSVTAIPSTSNNNHNIYLPGFSKQSV